MTRADSRFLWCTMIQTNLGSLIQIGITPKERNLSGLRLFNTTFRSRFSVRRKVSAVMTLFRTVGIRLFCKLEPSVLFCNASGFFFISVYNLTLWFATPSLSHVNLFNYMRCNLHYMWCILHYMRCILHYMWCLSHYMHCFSYYMRCFRHYTRYFCNDRQCFLRYMRCFGHYTWYFCNHMQWFRLYMRCFRRCMWWFCHYMK